MQWEKLSVPFRVDVDVENIVLARMRDQVLGQRGFNAFNLVAAAGYFIQKKINLDEALSWSQRAALTRSWQTLSTLSSAYTALNKMQQADSAMNEALTFANANQYLNYDRSLITAKRLDRALEVANGAQKKFGDVYSVNTTYVYYYSAKGDYKKALDYANKALAQAPNDAAKTTMNAHITRLKEGKDVN